MIAPILSARRDSDQLSTVKFISPAPYIGLRGRWEGNVGTSLLSTSVAYIRSGTYINDTGAAANRSTLTYIWQRTAMAQNSEKAYRSRVSDSSISSAGADKGSGYSFRSEQQNPRSFAHNH